MAKPLSEMSMEELQSLRAQRIQATRPSVGFKNQTVATEYSQVYGPLRDLAEEAPVPTVVTSGKRSAEQNAAVGGAPNSYHTVGGALDLRKSENDPLITDYYTKKGYKVIDEGDHLHIQPSSRRLLDTSNPLSRYSLKELQELRAQHLQKAQSQEFGGDAQTPTPVSPESLQDASVSTQRNPYIRRLAEGRLKERNESDYLGRPIPADQLNGQLDDDTIQQRMAHMRANRMDRAPIENANQHWYSPIEDRKLSDEELRAKVVQDLKNGELNRQDIGNFLYGIGDFKAPWVAEDDPAKSLLARGVGTMETLFPTTSYNPDESLPFNQRRDQNREIEQEVRNLRKEQSPNAHSTGRIAGDVVAYNSIMKLLGAVGLGPAPAVVGEAGAAGGAAGAGAKKGVELMKAVLRGGTAGAGVGQLSGSEAKDAPMDAALGAGFEALPVVLSSGVKGLQFVGSKLRDLNKSELLSQKINNTFDAIPFWGKIRKGWRDHLEKDALSNFNANQEALKIQLDNLKNEREFLEKNAREVFDSNKQNILNKIDDLNTQHSIASSEASNTSAKLSGKLSDLKDINTQAVDEAKAAYAFNKVEARNKLRDLSQYEPAELGEKFLNKIKKSKQKLSEEYGQVSDRLMDQHGAFPAPVDDLRREITDTLRDNGLLTPKGNVNLAKLNLIQAPERKRMVQVLINIRKALRLNPTIKGLNSLKQDLQSLANYGAPVRTSEEGLFGKLAEKAKGAVDDALSQAAGSGASEFQAVRKKYAQQKPTLDALAKTATRLPERLVVNARVQFPKSKVQEILKTNPEFKDEIGNFVFEHITQTPASQNTIRKTMDYYGRDFLKGLLGPEKFKLLEKSEMEITQASRKFSPKNLLNEEYQRRIGEIVGPEEMGPYSLDSGKKIISRKQAENSAKQAENSVRLQIKKKELQKQLVNKKFSFEDPTKLLREELQKQLTKKFDFQDPNIAKIQKALTKILGGPRISTPKFNWGSFGDALVDAVPPILINRKNQ